MATSVAARGIDVPETILVVNYDCPNHFEDYVHRCGYVPFFLSQICIRKLTVMFLMFSDSALIIPVPTECLVYENEYLSTVLYFLLAVVRDEQGEKALPGPL